MSDKHGSRRQFLGQSAAAAAGVLATPYFFTSAQAQDAAKAAASDRLRLGSIGLGGQGRNDMHAAIQFADLVAVCDVDSSHARQAQQETGGKAEIYEDYRKVLDRKDVDVVTIATPDHWHTKIAIDAMLAGKDVHCQKPLTLTIDEGKKICEVVKRTGRVFQVGTQQRTEFNQLFLQAIALVRSGRLGKVSKVQCAIGSAPESGAIPTMGAPSELNWEVWQGQTPLVDFRQQNEKKDEAGKIVTPYHSRCHYEFRWWLEYSGGKLTDWGAHHVDIATWALGLDKTGPASVRVVSSKFPVPMKDGYPTQADRYNTPTQFQVVAEYPEQGIELTIRNDTDNGILFTGDKGRIFVSRDKLAGKPVEDLKDNPLPADAIKQVYGGKEPTSHMGNFIDCVKSRARPISDVFSHHRAITTCHLANIALRLDREIRWDAEKEQIVGDEQANAFLSREQRKGYEIKV